VVNGFIGAQGEDAVRQFIETLLPSEIEIKVAALVAAGDETSLREALDLDPGSESAVVTLAELLVDKGERSDALALLERIPETAETRRVAALARVGDELSGQDASADEMTAKLDELLASTSGSRRLDLGGGVTAVREYDSVWVERTPVALEGEVQWGGWRIAADLPGLKVRSWRAGDRLAGRSKKIQDVFVDAKIPRSARESWPLVVRGDEVVAVPGIVDAEGVRVERVAD
jgi:tRNA(Ile)-lysidine synthetase-like protein